VGAKCHPSARNTLLPIAQEGHSSAYRDSRKSENVAGYHMATTEPPDTTIDELDQRFYMSEGRRLEIELRGLALSFRTYHANAIQLMGAVRLFEDPFSHDLLTPPKHKDLVEYCHEVVRFFQNTVTAGQSFLEHTQTSVRRRVMSHDSAGQCLGSLRASRRSFVVIQHAAES
jgi:hypothetical protein